MTAVAESDERLMSTYPPAKLAAATQFINGMVVAAPKSYRLVSREHTQDVLGGQLPAGDGVRDDSAAIAAYAEQLALTVQDRRITALPAIPCIETAYDLGERISEIRGRQLRFATSTGPQTQYPAVLERRFVLRDGCYETQLVLGVTTARREGKGRDMQTIHIAVVRSRKYRATDGFEVYSDRGAGTMDWVHAETPRRLMFWEDAPAGAGHLLGGQLMNPQFDGVRPDGHLEGTHLLDEQGYPGATLTYDSEPLVFGRFQHAVVTRDAAGNALTEGIVIYETMINSAPPQASDLRVAAYDYDLQRFEFSFKASPRLID